MTSSAPSLTFNIETNFLSKIKTVKLNTTGNFDVRGSIKWLKVNKEQVQSYSVLKSLLEAILFDEDDHIPFTVWKGLIDELKEETIYLFQTITLKNYYGSKLTTTKFTIISTEDGPASFTVPNDIGNYVETELHKRLHPKLCCPELASVTLDVFPGCTNKNCSKNRPKAELLLLLLNHFRKMLLQAVYSLHQSHFDPSASDLW